MISILELCFIPLFSEGLYLRDSENTRFGATRSVLSIDMFSKTLFDLLINTKKFMLKYKDHKIHCIYPKIA